MRYLSVIWLLLVVAVVCPTVLADDVLILKPPLVCPSTKMGSEELQAKYDSIWTDYRKAMDKAWTALGDEIEAQRANAQESGNLPLLEFWLAEKSKHAERKELSWDPIGLRKTWKERFGTIFPTRAGDAYSKYFRAYATARTTLEASYLKVVAEVTKSGDVAKAKTLQAEASNLSSVSKPEIKPAVRTFQQGAVEFQGHKYKLFEEHLDFNQAKAKCEAMGGHLVCLETQAEHEFVTKWLRPFRFNTEGPWLGGSDLEKEGVWKWVTGEPFTFTAWAKGQPSHYAGEHWLFWKAGVMQWVDVGGDYRTSWICEWDE